MIIKRNSDRKIIDFYVRKKEESLKAYHLIYFTMGGEIHSENF